MYNECKKLFSLMLTIGRDTLYVVALGAIVLLGFAFVSLLLGVLGVFILFLVHYKTLDTTHLIDKFTGHENGFRTIIQETERFPDLQKVYLSDESGAEPSVSYLGASQKPGEYRTLTEAMKSVDTDFLEIPHQKVRDEFVPQGVYLESERVVTSTSTLMIPASLRTGWVYLFEKPDEISVEADLVRCTSKLLTTIDYSEYTEFYIPLQSPNWYAYCRIETPRD